MNMMRGGAVVARLAHNQKVVGAIPTPAPRVVARDVKPAPSLREQLRASRNLPPDTLDLFGALGDAASELSRLSGNAYSANDIGRRVSRTDIADARHAAQSVLDAVAAYEAGGVR
jgi:hypothetical protein